MNRDESCGSLFGFDNVQAIDTLLSRLNVEPDLGAFLSKHIRDVLRKQHAGLEMESVTLLSVGDCSIDGRQVHDTDTAEVDSLTLPFIVNVVVDVSGTTFCLTLDICIRANAGVQPPVVESDIRIRKQAKL